MPLSDEDYNRHSTYFGVFSAAQAAQRSEMLKGIGVRYEFVPHEQDEERLRAWRAWEETAVNPHEGQELYIHDDDLDTVGYRIVQMYPWRGDGTKPDKPN